MELHRPIGIFDAGIGSYAGIERVRARFPRQDILYFADRASFPYGAKTPAELLLAVQSATQYFPPLREAIQRSKTKQAAVLGVRAMITSEAMRAFVDANCTTDGQVFLVNASSLVDLVENFTSITDRRHTQEIVTTFVTDVGSAHPGIDVMTMSSTHLPWLKPLFTIAAPDVSLLDQADTVLGELEPVHVKWRRANSVCCNRNCRVARAGSQCRLAGVGCPAPGNAGGIQMSRQ